MRTAANKNNATYKTCLNVLVIYHMITYKYMPLCKARNFEVCNTYVNKEKPKSLLPYQNCNIKYIKFILYKHELELANPQFTPTVVVY